METALVGLFGYYGYVARGASDLCVIGANRLCDGVWNLSEVDPERGFCGPKADAEHTAEWTGNTLGLMMQIDYGNPLWIERSMKTGKLIRDLWTDYNDMGRRHFKSNFFGATQIGSGLQMNDSFINYRAISASTSVLAYNRNPTIGKLYTELADAWLYDSMRTDGGKPTGIIPAQVGWPDGRLGGVESPNWWSAVHQLERHPRTINYDWWNEKTKEGQKYKGYVGNLLMAAYQYTGETKYFDPFKAEFELAKKYGYEPIDTRKKKNWKLPKGDKGLTAKPGSELWVAARLQNTQTWPNIERMLKGRQGKVGIVRTKEDIIKTGIFIYNHLEKYWPMFTSEAGPTDRVGFKGIGDAFMIYTGGYRGGPLLKASVTYENTTKDFAAAVLGCDAQGMKILFYSMAPDARMINLVPWELEEAGKYRLVYGIDKNGDGETDKVVEKRDFFFKQVGSKIPIEVKPWTEYVIEIEQIERGRPSDALRPDPGLSVEDVNYNTKSQSITATVHNVGSKAVSNLKVAFYKGSPKTDGELIAVVTIPEIEAPNDLEPRMVTVSATYPISRGQQDIYVVLDPDGKFTNEITTFNNMAHAMLPKPPKQKIEKKTAGLKLNQGGYGP